MQTPTTKHLDCFCQRCQKASRVTILICESPLDDEDLLYSWTCPVCGISHLGVVFGKNGKNGKENVKR